MKKFLIPVFLVLAFASCKKNDNPTSNTTTAGIQPGHGAFILNQGGFNKGNASVSYLNLDSMVVHNDVFTKTNGITLGDVAQSITIDASNAYVVVNNSQRVEYVSCKDLKIIKSIDGLASPRYVLKVATGKAYISDLSSGKISILNTSSNSVTGTITVKQETERMLQVGNEVFVTAPGSYNLYVINSTTDAITDSIPVGFGYSSGDNTMSLDKNGKLWLYCVGDAFNNINPSLYQIDPATHTVLKNFSFPNATYEEGSMCMNKAQDSLFFIHGDLYQMAITDAVLPSAAAIPSDGKTFDNLVKLSDGRMIASDVKDYTQNGTIYIYSANGTLIKSFDVGVIPAQVVVY